MRFVYFTDVHLLEGTKSVEGFARTLTEIATLSPDLVICGGDVGMDSACGELYTRMMDSLGVPHYLCFGNHEMDSGMYDATRGAGQTSQSWDCAGVHFVILDTVRPMPEEADKTHHNWWGNVDEPQLEWLKADLEAVPVETPVIFATHIPLLSSYTHPNCISISEEEYPPCSIKGGEKIMEILQRRRSVATLHGHLHENMRYNVGNLQHLMTGAVAGIWWKNSLESFNMDGSPQGFRVVEVQRDTITSRYQAVVPAQRRETGLHHLGDSQWAVNVLDGSRETQVELVGEAPLPFIERPFYQGQVHSYRPGHVWELPEGFDRMKFAVKVRFEDGRTVEEELEVR